jgi:hypothetical protein
MGGRAGQVAVVLAEADGPGDAVHPQRDDKRSAVVELSEPGGRERHKAQARVTIRARFSMDRSSAAAGTTGHVSLARSSSLIACQSQ